MKDVGVLTTKFICLLATTAVVFLAACGSSGSDGAAPSTASGPSDTTAATDDGLISSGSGSFTAEVWADNWFALYVNGELVGEDSVPITTERSFNAETIAFEADYPLTIAIEAKDFKETESGIEYIGEPNQQMGDGGLIAQITDDATGEVVAITDESWSTLVVQQAPLNTECAQDPDPDETCEVASVDPDADWFAPGYNDAAWDPATTWTEAEVSPKDGYDEISWASGAQLVWGTDLEVDNTVFFRIQVAA